MKLISTLPQGKKLKKNLTTEFAEGRGGNKEEFNCGVCFRAGCLPKPARRTGRSFL